ncbi:MAG: HK97 gp10 family phage protein [Elusimicrobia bacterium]|nr:HK97 gp10 family phage protein [Elusimicrobiota bacterium]
MSILEFSADFTGALQKMAAVNSVPKAARKLLSIWGAQTVKELKRSAADQQKSISPLHKKTGQMARSVAMEVDTASGIYKVAVGTNLKTSPVKSKYGHIQDVGGTTHPNVTDKMRKWAWFAYYKTQGAVRREARSVLPNASRSTIREMGRAGASKYFFLAITKKAKLDVKVPASRWFSKVIDQRSPVLDSMLAGAAVLKKAEEMIASGEVTPVGAGRNEGAA